MLNVKLGLRTKQENSSLFVLHLSEELVSLAYHLMLVYELLSSPRSPDEIEAAILAATSLAAYGGDDVAQGVERNRIARQLLYPSDKVSLHSYFAAQVLILQVLILLVLALQIRILDNHRIGEDDDVASPEIIAIHPVHYHPIALFQLWRQTSLGHREDSESKRAHAPG